MKQFMNIISCRVSIVILMVVLLLLFLNCNNAELDNNNIGSVLLNKNMTSHVFNTNIDSLKIIIENNLQHYRFKTSIGKKNMKGKDYFEMEMESINNCFFYKSYFSNPKNKNNFYLSSGYVPAFPSDVYYSERTKKPLDCIAEFAIELMKVTDTSTCVTVKAYKYRVICGYKFPRLDIEGKIDSRPIWVDVESTANEELELLCSIGMTLGDTIEYKPVISQKIYLSRKGHPTD